jgi:deoxyribonuclease-1-like protein
LSETITSCPVGHSGAIMEKQAQTHSRAISTCVAVAAAILVAIPFALPAYAQKSSYYVGSFNIQNLGAKKVAKPALRREIAGIIREFDVVAVQEVSDVTERAPQILLEEINKAGVNYRLLLSPRSGQQPEDRTSQEQYAFYYNSARIKAVGEASLFDDSKNNHFKREPYTGRFQIIGTDFTFTVTQVHTAPSRALPEIKALIHVYKGLKERFDGEESHVIVGDFNASCSYAKPAQLDALEIRKSRDLTWLVGDDYDTTAGASNCAYDRIIINRAIKPRFSKWGIGDDWFKGTAVSDHYPVWVSFTAQ